MNIWAHAKSLSEQTPPERNRYVDFLRAISILFVITGHWLIAVAHYTTDNFNVGDLLSIAPWTQWLTWAFQVMPIFFIVGGYSNAVSLASANKKGMGYADWLSGRLVRLVTPLLVLIVVWAGIALLFRFFGTSRDLIQLASQAALIPIWFLAIYILVVVLAPATYTVWKRWGLGSVFGFVALAALNDWIFFNTDNQWLGWSNYLWIWLGVTQLGYAWREQRIKLLSVRIGMALVGLVCLLLMVIQGPYPVAMAGSPGEGISNSLPPKFTLFALGLFQFGVLLSLEEPLQRILQNTRVWAATILVNGMIMTVYLWHITVMILVVSLAYLLGGIGLHPEPGSSTWWWYRIPWMALMYSLLVLVALPLSRFERGSIKPTNQQSAVRLVIGAVVICGGIAFLARFGYMGGPSWGLDIVAFGLIFTGSYIAGVFIKG